MKIVQIVLDQSLLDATDRAAQRMKQNRSELVREALQEHLKRLDVQLSEERDRAGYSKHPQTQDEVSMWAGEAVWPAE